MARTYRKCCQVDGAGVRRARDDIVVEDELDADDGVIDEPEFEDTTLGSDIVDLLAAKFDLAVRLVDVVAVDAIVVEW